jgi:nitroreductase
VVVVANVVPDPDHPKSSRIPRSEQRDSTASAVQNLLLAATSLGYGSMWRSGAACQDPLVKAALGLWEEDEAVAFVYLGTIPPGMDQPPNEPDLAGLVQRFTVRQIG